MTLRHRPPGVVAGNRADGNGATRRTDRLAHPARVRVAANAVDDHRGDVQRGIEALEAEHGGRGAARLGGRVHDEDDRRPQPPGDLRRRAGVAAAVDAVEAAHHPLDDRDVGLRGAPRDGGQHGLAAAHPAVEVVGRAPRRDLVQPGIDEVGTDLERLHAEAAPAQRAQQSERDRRLADAARRARDHENARHAGPSTPADLKVAISA